MDTQMTPNTEFASCPADCSGGGPSSVHNTGGVSSYCDPNSFNPSHDKGSSESEYDHSSNVLGHQSVATRRTGSAPLQAVAENVTHPSAGAAAMMGIPGTRTPFQRTGLASHPPEQTNRCWIQHGSNVKPPRGSSGGYPSHPSSPARAPLEEDPYQALNPRVSYGYGLPSAPPLDTHTVSQGRASGYRIGGVLNGKRPVRTGGRGGSVTFSGTAPTSGMGGSSSGVTMGSPYAPPSAASPMPAQGSYSYAHPGSHLVSSQGTVAQHQQQQYPMNYATPHTAMVQNERVGKRGIPSTHISSSSGTMMMPSQAHPYQHPYVHMQQSHNGQPTSGSAASMNSSAHLTSPKSVSTTPGHGQVGSYPNHMPPSTSMMMHGHPPQPPPPLPPMQLASPHMPSHSFYYAYATSGHNHSGSYPDFQPSYPAPYSQSLDPNAGMTSCYGNEPWRGAPPYQFPGGAAYQANGYPVHRNYAPSFSPRPQGSSAGNAPVYQGYPPYPYHSNQYPVDMVMEGETHGHGMGNDGASLNTERRSHQPQTENYIRDTSGQDVDVPDGRWAAPEESLSAVTTQPTNTATRASRKTAGQADRGSRRPQQTKGTSRSTLPPSEVTQSYLRPIQEDRQWPEPTSASHRGGNAQEVTHAVCCTPHLPKNTASSLSEVSQPVPGEMTSVSADLESIVGMTSSKEQDAAGANACHNQEGGSLLCDNALALPTPDEVDTKGESESPMIAAMRQPYYSHHHHRHMSTHNTVSGSGGAYQTQMPHRPSHSASPTSLWPPGGAVTNHKDAGSSPTAGVVSSPLAGEESNGQGTFTGRGERPSSSRAGGLATAMAASSFSHQLRLAPPSTPALTWPTNEMGELPGISSAAASSRGSTTGAGEGPPPGAPPSSTPVHCSSFNGTSGKVTSGQQRKMHTQSLPSPLHRGERRRGGGPTSAGYNHVMHGVPPGPPSGSSMSKRLAFNGTASMKAPTGGLPQSSSPSILYEHYTGQELWVEEQDSDMVFDVNGYGNIACLMDAISPEVPVSRVMEIPLHDDAVQAYEPEERHLSREAERCSQPSRYTDFDGPSFIEPVATLGSIWRGFDFPFGCSVPLARPVFLNCMRAPDDQVVYVPLLSGFRIGFHAVSQPYRYLKALYEERSKAHDQALRDTSNEGTLGSSLRVAGAAAAMPADGVLTWSASERPDNRNMVVEQVHQLAQADAQYAPLLTATTADVDHTSWVALLWQPVFCGNHAAKQSCGSFLAFYLLRPPRHVFRPYADVSCGAAMNSSWHSPVFRVDRAAVAFDLWTFRRRYDLGRESTPVTAAVCPCVDDAGAESEQAGAASMATAPPDDGRQQMIHSAARGVLGLRPERCSQHSVRLPVVGLIPNRCRSDVWFTPSVVSPVTRSQLGSLKASGNQWPYRAPLFLLASALQLVTRNAYEEHERQRLLRRSPSRRGAGGDGSNDTAMKSACPVVLTAQDMECASPSVDAEARVLSEAVAEGGQPASMPNTPITMVSPSPQGESATSVFPLSEPEGGLAIGKDSGENHESESDKQRAVGGDQAHPAYYLRGVELLVNAAREYRLLRDRAMLDAVVSTEEPPSAALSLTEGRCIDSKGACDSGGASLGVLVAGGTNIYRSGATGGVICGLLDFYQWAQYDTALSTFLNKYGTY